MLARVPILLGALFVVGGLGVGVWRVAALEADELEHVGDPVALEPTDGEPHRELARVHLDAGEDVTFEVCAPEPFSGDWAGAVDIAVWDPEAQELLTRTALDAARLARAHPVGAGECVVVAKADDLGASGVIAMEALWPAPLPPEIARVPLRAHVIAHRPIAPWDRWPVWAALFGAALAVVGTAWARRPAPEVEPGSGRGALARVLGGLALLVVASVAVGFAPFYGSTMAFARGLLLAAVQIGAALVLVHARGTERARVLGVAAPPSAWPLVAAPVVGLFLWALGGVLVRIVPSTGEAPIEAMVAWPSGLLAVALVAVVVPLAEELFFRGFVYGALERRYGAGPAFGATVLLFAAAHLPQVWNAWGALAAILLTGVVLTGLRARTGSVLVPALAHLFYNGVNVVLGLS